MRSHFEKQCRMADQGSLFSLKKVLWPVLLVLVLAARPALVQADTYCATWNEYVEAEGLTKGHTYNDVVDGVESVMEAAVATYKKGDADTALEQVAQAKNNYWGGSGMKIDMQKKLPSASKKTTEADFASCNTIIKGGGSADELSTAKDVLIADLRLLANKLDGVEEEVEISEEKDTAATELFAQKYYGTWEEYSKAAGLEGVWPLWSWPAFYPCRFLQEPWW